VRLPSALACRRVVVEGGRAGSGRERGREEEGAGSAVREKESEGDGGEEGGRGSTAQRLLHSNCNTTATRDVYDLQALMDVYDLHVLRHSV